MGKKTKKQNRNFNGGLFCSLPPTDRKEEFEEIRGNASKQVEFTAYWDIMEEKLFYNKSTLEQVSEIAEILDREIFEKVVGRALLKRPNLPFIVLLHGPSGTGKTALVREICRRTKRHLIEIRTEQLRHEGLGNDEKAIKNIFDDYMCTLGCSEEYPILFFDECEAHLCGRLKMDNYNPSMINHLNNITGLWLKEFQKFHGIMFLATNRKEDIDEAFARRVLFEIEIAHPEKDIQAAIWAYLFPRVLAPEDCQRLAEETDFTGGQIKQVQTKADLHEILHGQLNYNIIRRICETNGKPPQKRKTIGFKC